MCAHTHTQTLTRCTSIVWSPYPPARSSSLPSPSSSSWTTMVFTESVSASLGLHKHTAHQHQCEYPCTCMCVYVSVCVYVCMYVRTYNSLLCLPQFLPFLLMGNNVGNTELISLPPIQEHTAASPCVPSCSWAHFNLERRHLGLKC